MGTNLYASTIDERRPTHAISLFLPCQQPPELTVRTMPMSRRIKEFIQNDSLTIALLGLFLVCVMGQSASGWSAYEQSLHQAGFPPVSFAAYLGTGIFLDGILSNWQAAILQLTVLVAFSSVLRQRGAAHSRKPSGEAKSPSHRTLDWKPHLKSSIAESLYANSLTLALLAVFAITFVLHGVFGAMKHDEEQALRHLPPVSIGSYFGSAGFWFSVLQTWEAEFFAIALYIVFSIFLRQESSSESKPVEASDDQTGETNE